MKYLVGLFVCIISFICVGRERSSTFHSAGIEGRDFIYHTAANRGMTARNRLSRRTALRTIGAFGSAALATTTAVSARESAPETAADQYIGVVDRVVDGRHVVMLLEEDNQVVDQLVLDVDEFDGVRERDVFVVVLKDEELHRYQRIPEKPESTGQNN